MTILDAFKTSYIQSIVGSLFYNKQAIGTTDTLTLNVTSSSKYNSTALIKLKYNLLIEKRVIYQDLFVSFYVSDLILYVDTDTIYLVDQQAHSRVAEFFQLV